MDATAWIKIWWGTGYSHRNITQKLVTSYKANVYFCTGETGGQHLNRVTWSKLTLPTIRQDHAARLLVSRTRKDSTSLCDAPETHGVNLITRKHQTNPKKGHWNTKQLSITVKNQEHEKQKGLNETKRSNDQRNAWAWMGWCFVWKSAMKDAFGGCGKIWIGTVC